MAGPPGAAGAAGADGTLLDRGSVYVVRSGGNVATVGNAQVSAQCRDRNDIMLGGTCHTDDPFEAPLTGSEYLNDTVPQASLGYRCDAYVRSGTHMLAVTVRCIDVPN